MQVQRNFVLRTFAYTCLVVGSVLFSFPFVWMVSSSIKVDRELFPEKIQIFPGTPNAISQSPFIDQYYYDTDVNELVVPHLGTLEKVLRASDFHYPDTIPQDLLIETIARGLGKRLDILLQPEAWQEPESALQARVEALITPEMINGLVENVYRRMLIGQLRIRSYSLEEQELGKDIPFSQRLQVKTPETLELFDTQDRGTDCALLRYDLSKGARWILEGVFETEFDVSDLHRVQLYLRPDDNWHRLSCYIEKLGARFESVEAVYPANFEWGTFTWQEPGPEDQTTKIKTWNHLREVDRGTQYVSGTNRIKIGFVLQRSSQLQAWIGKVTRNYNITVRHIPVWRYAATSLYLVLLNVALSVFSCSVVAYAVARLNWPGRDFCFLLMLATMMVPAQVTMIPNFLIWKNLGYYNTLVPLWFGAAFAAPFSVFLLRQFLKGIPKDLEEAARIDGCGYFRVYWHIMFPLVKPTLAVIAIGAFMGSWNNFMGPLIFISDQRLYPLAFGIYAFAVQVGNNPSLTMAGSFMMTVPIIVIFFFAQRYFIQGVTLTGLKG